MNWQSAFRILCFLVFILPTVKAQSDQFPPQVPQTLSHKHIKDKDDIQAIGNRNIGKEGVGNWYSLEKESSVGREYAAEIDRSVQFVTDPIITEYINSVPQNIIRNSDAKVAFTIKVVDSDEINAYALPGGFMYVNSGLILAVQEKAELEGVMAHEIAHVA